MNKITLSSDLKDLFKYVIVGAIGFGIGGIVWRFINLSFMLNIMVILNELIKGTLGGVFLGLIGGMFLFLLAKNKKVISILAGAVGFGIGYFVSYLIAFMLTILVAIGIHMPPIFYLHIGFFVGGALAGTIYGSMLGVKSLSVLAGLSGVGMGLGFLISGIFFGNLTSVAYYLIIAVFIGAFFGLGLYLSENYNNEHANRVQI